MISFSCTCGAKCKAPDKYAGKKAVCRTCNSTLYIPNQDKVALRPVNARCIMCGCSFSVSEENRGQVLPCPECSSNVLVRRNSSFCQSEKVNDSTSSYKKPQREPDRSGNQHRFIKSDQNTHSEENNEAFTFKELKKKIRYVFSIIIAISMFFSSLRVYSSVKAFFVENNVAFTFKELEKKIRYVFSIIIAISMVFSSLRVYSPVKAFFVDDIDFPVNFGTLVIWFCVSFALSLLAFSWQCLKCPSCRGLCAKKWFHQDILSKSQTTCIEYRTTVHRNMYGEKTGESETPVSVPATYYELRNFYECKYCGYRWHEDSSTTV